MLKYLGSSAILTAAVLISALLASAPRTIVDTVSAAAPPAKTGACCFSDGTCQIMTQKNCQRAGGTYLGNNTTCAQCPVPTGACCADGGCVQVTSSQCASLGGEYFGNGSSCIQIICAPTGACCLPVLPPACDVRSASSCLAIGGTYLGDNVACTSTICGDVGPDGACCITELGGTFCLDTSEMECWITWGGAWQGAFTTCAETECPEFPPPPGDR